MTCRGSRRNTVDKAKNIYEDSPEWLAQNMRSTRNFIRKWGHFVKHDALMKPIVPNKYDVEFRVFNSNLNLLTLLEPWCSRIYVDNPSLVEPYIQQEQPNTQIDLSNRINIEGVNSEITVRVDGNTFNQQDFGIIQQLSEIIQDSGQIGKFKLGNLEISIQGMTEYQNELINL